MKAISMLMMMTEAFMIQIQSSLKKAGGSHYDKPQVSSPFKGSEIELINSTLGTWSP